MQEVDQWLSNLGAAMPIRAVAKSHEEGTIQSFLDRFPSLLGSEREAMLWLRVGLIDRAHAIVQDANRGPQAYIHGVIHRLEGDYWNANYWFHRVRSADFQSGVAKQVEGSLANLGPFDPSQFTSRVEAALKSKNSALQDELQRVAKEEWDGIWNQLD